MEPDFLPHLLLTLVLPRGAPQADSVMDNVVRKPRSRLSLKKAQPSDEDKSLMNSNPRSGSWESQEAKEPTGRRRCLSGGEGTAPETKPAHPPSLPGPPSGEVQSLGSIFSSQMDVP